MSAAATKTLQSKLANLREQTRAMDASIDNYRRQLDEAKQQLQQKESQIQHYAQITQMINSLTGNRAPLTEITGKLEGPGKAT